MQSTCVLYRCRSINVGPYFPAPKSKLTINIVILWSPQVVLEDIPPMAKGQAEIIGTFHIRRWGLVASQIAIFFFFFSVQTFNWRSCEFWISSLFIASNKTLSSPVPAWFGFQSNVVLSGLDYIIVLHWHSKYHFWAFSPSLLRLWKTF